MNPGMSGRYGRLESARATVTAGLANEVDTVNQ
jgi:hypothetical protein